jgi:hypothetical protein
MRKNSRSAPSTAQSSSKTRKLYNPSAQFGKPTEILGDVELSKEEKKAALDNTWEQDARQLMTQAMKACPESKKACNLQTVTD